MVMVATVRYPMPGGGVPIGVAETDHGRVLSDHVDDAKGRRTPTAQPPGGGCGDREPLVAMPGLRPNATTADNSMVNNSIQGKEPSSRCPASPIAVAPARASVARA